MSRTTLFLNLENLSFRWNRNRSTLLLNKQQRRKSPGSVVLILLGADRLKYTKNKLKNFRTKPRKLKF